MLKRFSFGALLIACFVVPFTGCNNSPSLTTIVISPTTVTVTLAPPGFQQGQSQFKAIGYYGHAGHQTTMDITSQVTWSSSAAQVATINSSGLATATGFNPLTGEGWTGNTNITASAPGFNGTIVSNSATFTVTACTSCAADDISSVTVIPVSQTVATVGIPVQFEAIGMTVGGASVPLTNVSGIQWTSSVHSVATICTVNSAAPCTSSTYGLATTAGSGTTTITATFTNPDGSGAAGSATLTVSPAGSSEPLASLAVSPSSQTVQAGNLTANFIAIGTTGTGATVNLTDPNTYTVPGTSPAQTIQWAQWSSSNPSVASIDPNTGIISAKAAGVTAITAIAKNPDNTVAVGSALLTVTAVSEPLASLAVSPSTQTVMVGNQTANFIAIGTLGSGGTVNLTDPQTYTIPGTSPAETIQWAQWNSSNPSVASVDPNTGIITAKAAGATAITAIATNPDGTVVTGSAILTVSSTSEPLVSLAIVPSSQTSLTTGTGANVNFIALGTTSSGATVNMNLPYIIPGTSPAVTIPAATWTSSNSAVVATITATGVATPKGAGTTAIVAMVTNPDGTVVAASAAYTVTIPTVTEPYVSLAIIPASQTATTAGQTAQYIAIGTTGTGATVDLTSVATWNSTIGSVATIIGPGMVQAGAISGATAITAKVANPGVGGNPPDGTVVTASATFTVSITGTSEPLLSLSILPSSQSVAGAPQTTQFLAIGDFSATSSTPGNQNMANISTYTVNWHSSNPSVATIGLTTGLVTAVGPGTSAITAIATNNSDHSGATAAASFTVTGAQVEPISALSIFPGSQSITLPLPSMTNQTAQFIAIGTNGTSGLQTDVSSLVSWSSTNPLVATIDTTGMATAIGQGSTTITAKYTNPSGAGSGIVTATATLTVANVASEPLLSVAILPTSQSLASPNQTSQLLAIGTFSSAPVTQDVTKGISSYPITTKWSSSNPAVATVCSPDVPSTCTTSPVHPGLVTSVGQGTAAIVAISSNPDGSLVTSTIPFTVVGGTSEQFTSLTIYPNNQAASAASQTSQFFVIGTAGSSGLQYDVTNLVQWCSGNPAVATIGSALAGSATCWNVTSGAGSTPGLVTALFSGATTLSATYTNLDGSKVVGTATYTVTIGAAPEPLLSITIIPTAISVNQILDSGNFLAFGNYSSTPTIRDITNEVTWISSAPDVFPVETAGVSGAQAGIVTAYGEGGAVIIAEMVRPASCASNPSQSICTDSNPDGTVVTAQGTFTCPIGQCGNPVAAQLATLTVYNAGQNNSSWLVTAPSSTGVPNLIHCGPSSPGLGLGFSVCVGTYPIGSTVTLTESPAGSSFGGWSDNCETALNTPNTTPTCTVTLTSNYTVGAIFN
ncbi:MAG: Ig-like domain-containing protein [Terracidiphilus sp.]|jgi:hypothetical protein